MIRRARVLAVLGMLLAGAIGIIGSTQTWLTVQLVEVGSEPLLVPGATAIPVLAPLSLAVLALGGALSIVGTVLRYAFGAIGLLIALALGTLAAQVTFAPTVGSYAATVTEATGLAGTDAVSSLVASVAATPWPALTLAAEVVLAAVALFTLVTARSWSGGAGRRYRTASTPAAAGTNASRPHDAIDSWDDLSRGDDPTA